MEKQILEELVQGLLAFLEKTAVRIVLFGSTARGTAGPESDIDVALFLTERLTPAQEERLTDLVVELNLKYDKVLSVMDIDQETYMKWRQIAPFYQNVDREGVVLWKAA